MVCSFLCQYSSVWQWWKSWNVSLFNNEEQSSYICKKYFTFFTFLTVFVFQIQLSRNQVSNQLINEPITITVPLIYDISANGLSIGGERYSHVNVMNIVSNILKRFSEYNGKLCVLCI